MLIILGGAGGDTVNDVELIPVEIETSSKGAIHDPRNGLRQLSKYPGHAKYLAIPSTVGSRSIGKEIRRRCRRWGAGLLIVDHRSSRVSCEVEPEWTDSERSLRAYPVAMRRWLALRASGEAYRRISGQRILEQE